MKTSNEISLDIIGITESINILNDRLEKPGVNVSVIQRDSKTLQTKRRTLKSIID